MTEKNSRPMSPKEEKEWGKDEKQDEKTQEKEMGKRWDEKWNRDPLSAIVWAAILIWVGVLFLIWNLGLLEDVALPGTADAWAIVRVGAGLILLAEVLIRLTIPTYSGNVWGSLILGVILFASGLGDITSSELVWPLIIIIVGLTVLLRGFRGQR